MQLESEIDFNYIREVSGLFSVDTTIIYKVLICSLFPFYSLLLKTNCQIFSSIIALSIVSKVKREIPDCE